MTWVFTGDSITQGAHHTRGYRGYVEHFHERMRWELRRVGDCVINTGVSGHTAGDVLADFDSRVARFRPDVVIAMLGTNDAVGGPGGREDYRRNLTALAARVRAMGAAPLLQTPPPIDSVNAPERADLSAYADVARQVAAELAIQVVDHHAHWLRCGFGRQFRNDALHPNARGHLEVAKKLFADLGVFDPASPTCALDLGAPRD